MLVELACSTALSPAYHPEFFRHLLITGCNDARSGGKPQKVVFIVCGGVKISFEELEDYRREIEVAEDRTEHVWEVFCNGMRWDFESRGTKAQHARMQL